MRLSTRSGAEGPGMTCSQEHPAEKHPEQPCANTQVLLRSLLSQRRGLLSLRILPGVYQVLTQTMLRPCGGRTVTGSPWGRRQLWLCGDKREAVFLSWRQAVHLAESQAREEQSGETAGFHKTSVPREPQVSVLNIISSDTLQI